MGRGGEPAFRRTPLVRAEPWGDRGYADWYGRLRQLADAYGIPEDGFPYELARDVEGRPGVPRYVVLVTGAAGAWYPGEAVAVDALDAALRAMLPALRSDRMVIPYDMRPGDAQGGPVFIERALLLRDLPDHGSARHAHAHASRARDIIESHPHLAQQREADTDLLGKLDRYMVVFETSTPLHASVQYYSGLVGLSRDDIQARLWDHWGLAAVYDLDAGTAPVPVQLGLRVFTSQGVLDVIE